MTSIDGYDVVETEISGVKVQHQNLHVGYAYFIPGLLPSWRRSNNQEQALQHALEDINSKGVQHEFRHSEASGGTPEYIFTLKQRIAELEAKAVEAK